MDFIVVQSESAVKFLALKLVGLLAFVWADVTDYSSVGIVIVVMSLPSFAMARHEGMACHLSDIADGSV